MMEKNHVFHQMLIKMSGMRNKRYYFEIRVYNIVIYMLVSDHINVICIE